MRQSKRKKFAGFTLFSVSLLVFYGCGYRMVGKVTTLPHGIQRVAVPVFENRTFIMGIEIPFTQSFIAELRKTGGIEVVSREDADTIVQGVIDAKRTESGHEATDLPFGKQIVNEYITAVDVRVNLVDAKTGKVLRGRMLTRAVRYIGRRDYLRNDTLERIEVASVAPIMMGKLREVLFMDF